MSTRQSQIVLRASVQEIPKREKLQNREGGFFHSFVLRVGVCAINQRVAEMARQQVAFNEKLNAMDRNFHAMDDIITGTNHYYDAQTGTKYDLSSATPFKWIDSGGRIVGTQTNVRPPGFSWRTLQQTPGQ